MSGTAFQLILNRLLYLRASWREAGLCGGGRQVSGGGAAAAGLGAVRGKGPREPRPFGRKTGPEDKDSEPRSTLNALNRVQR